MNVVYLLMIAVAESEFRVNISVLRKVCHII